MHQSDPSTPPEGADRARRRGILFRGSPTPPPYDVDVRTEALIASFQKVMNERLDEGLRALQQSAYRLMHEIASEVWRAADGDKDGAQSKILQTLSRAPAIGSLVAHSDERFQDLAVRTARMEDAVTALAEDTRAAKSALADGVQALERAVGMPAVQGYKELRGQLKQVTRNVASAFQVLADRDRIIVETVRRQVEEHGELISKETGRVAKAMEAYVQEGVNALGMLAGRIDAQVESMSDRDGDAAATHGAVERLLDQHIDLLNERIGIEVREIEASIQAAVTATRQTGQNLEGRIMGLARLVRADSEALRDEIGRTAASTDERIARILDEQLGRVSEALTSATRWTVEEMTRRFREEITRGADAQVSEAVERLTAAAPSVERTGRDDEGQLARVVDDRITALGRMIRSDNQALASRMQAAVEQEAAKQALRAVKEMHASLPNEIQEIVDGRVQAVAEQLRKEVQATADSVSKLGGSLERKLDETSSRIGQRQEREIKVVIDRMGDAMHALASLGQPGAERVEVD